MTFYASCVLQLVFQAMFVETSVFGNVDFMRDEDMEEFGFEYRPIKKRV
jgi:hypothetical protein